MKCIIYNLYHILLIYLAMNDIIPIYLAATKWPAQEPLIYVLACVCLSDPIIKQSLYLSQINLDLHET